MSTFKAVCPLSMNRVQLYQRCKKTELKITDMIPTFKSLWTTLFL